MNRHMPFGSNLAVGQIPDEGPQPFVGLVRQLAGNPFPRNFGEVDVQDRVAHPEPDEGGSLVEFHGFAWCDFLDYADDAFFLIFVCIRDCLHNPLLGQSSSIFSHCQHSIPASSYTFFIVSVNSRRLLNSFSSPAVNLLLPIR